MRITTRSITRSLPPRLLSLLALGALLTPSAVAQCTTTVLSNPNPVIAGNNLTAAIGMAGMNDVLCIQPGVYQGNFDITGTDITLQPTGAAQSVILDGGGSGTVLTIQNVTAATQIRDLVVRNGNSPSDGGGVFIQYASPQFSGCRIENNTAAGQGGGVYVFGNTFPFMPSIPKFTGCQVVGNSAGSNGGGIAFVGETGLLGTTINAIIAKTALRLNTAGSPGSPGLGGGIYAGMHLGSGNTPRVSIFRSRISENIVDGSGGGIAVHSGVALDVDHSTVIANTATWEGGGVWCDDACTLTARSCYVAENQAVWRGGGIFVQLYYAGDIRHCVIDHNSLSHESSLGGGIYISNIGGSYNGLNVVKGKPPTPQPGDPQNFHVQNNLIVENDSANGAGVTVEHATPGFAFNTFDRNFAADYETGGMLTINPTGFAVLLTVRNSIYWGNLGALVPTNPWEVELSGLNSTLVVSNDIRFSAGSGTLSPNNIDVDPLWTTGYTCPLSPIDGYFLSQPTPLSLCVDAGSITIPPSGVWLLTGRTTDPTGLADAIMSDLGYHYPPPNCP